MAVVHASGVRLLGLIALFFAMAGPVTAQRFKSSGYSALPPAGWVATTENIAKGSVAFVGPREKGFAVNMSISIDPAPRETLAQYVGAIHKQLATPKEMKLLKDGTRVVAGGTPAHTILAELHVPGHSDLPVLTVHEVFAMHKDRAYILTLTYPKGVAETSAQKYRAAFDKLVASFQWER